MKESWDNRISAKENLDNMGIVMSATELMPIISTKKSMVKKMKKMKNGSNDDVANKVQVTRPEVVEKLVQEANVERKQNFRFSSQQVKFITYMMDKHGDDYEAMSRDHKNHYQETPAKIRGMITKFISIPEHYAPYLKERGLLQTEENQDNDVVIDDSEQWLDLIPSFEFFVHGYSFRNYFREVTSQNGHLQEEDQEVERTRVSWTRKNWKAQEASRRLVIWLLWLVGTN